MVAVKKFNKGQVIIEEGSVGSVAYVIRSGSVQVSKKVGGEEVVLSKLGVGSIFGEMSLIDEKPRSASVTALEDTEVRVIDRKSFESILEQNPKMLLPVLRQVFSRVRYLNQMVAAFCDPTEIEAQESEALLITIRALTEESRRALGRESVQIKKIPFQIGRATKQSIFGTNDLDLQDIEPYQISRCHCLITAVDGQYYLVDSVSSKGTIVDSVRIGGREESKRFALSKGSHRLILGAVSSPYVFELTVG
ncbi:MAG: cyclic nucleotide-binding domain-containing protein [Deltaproteobacteria bacterium]|nr:cyclic nucleotide-binding domain-containing protein [Deltaproteobacteria bacterium]